METKLWALLIPGPDEVWAMVSKENAEADAELHNAVLVKNNLPEQWGVPPAPTFADGMTAEDDRRFLELTNDLTHNAKVSGAGTAALGHNVELSGPEAASSPEGRARLPGSAAGDREAP